MTMFRNTVIPGNANVELFDKVDGLWQKFAEDTANAGHLVGRAYGAR